MKKILSVMLIGMMVFAMFGCGSEKSPTDVAKEYMEACKSSDAAIWASDGIDSEGSDSMGMGDEMQKKLHDLMLDFDYTIDNEKIDGDSATVDVTVKTYNLGEAFSDALKKYFEEALPMAFAGASQEELEEAATKAFAEAFEDAGEEKSFEKTVTVSLTKGDDGWELPALDQDLDFADAMSGGTVNAVQDFAEGLSSGLGELGQ
ncbi:MAG: DUF5105 domain-containing protein [Firmicutes bacterium]|jgi:hypothetical protein|nr:DUF5105 domain-containing protein [Bacillota bacterium]